MTTCEPTLLVEPVKCADPGCKEMTLWKRPRQRKHGTCLDSLVPARTLTPAGVAVARRAVRASFPDVMIGVPEPAAAPLYDGELVRVSVRGRWVCDGSPWRFSGLVRPPDVGPCVTCGALMRSHYGPDGRAVCDPCRRQS